MLQVILNNSNPKHLTIFIPFPIPIISLKATSSPSILVIPKKPPLQSFPPSPNERFKTTKEQSHSSIAKFPP